MPSVGLQTDYVCARDFINASVAATQPVARKVRPRTLTTLVGTVGLICAASGYLGALESRRANLTNGVLAACFAFVIVCTLLLPDGVLVRPGAVFWRIVKAFCILYLCLLSFLMFQKLEDVQEALKLIDPSLRDPHPEKDYATDCQLYDSSHPDDPFHVIKDRLDVFVAAHFLGWFVKALLVRDFELLMIASFLFEIAELSLKFWLPNFAECWWDTWILDFCGCNLLGIIVGMKTNQLLHFTVYDWRYRRRRSRQIEEAELEELGRQIQQREDDKSGSGSASLEAAATADTLAPTRRQSYHDYSTRPRSFKLRRLSDTFAGFVEHMGPMEWQWYHFPKMTYNLPSFLLQSSIVLLVTVFDLNYFFLKTVLGLEPTHWLMVIRTVLMILVAVGFMRETYEYMLQCSTRRMPQHRRRLGVQAWLAFATVASEAGVIFRWRHVFDQQATVPFWLKLFWTSLAGIFFIVAYKLWRQSEKEDDNKRGKPEKRETGWGAWGGAYYFTSRIRKNE